MRATRPISPGRRHVREARHQRRRPCGPRTRCPHAPVAPVAGCTVELVWRAKRPRAQPAQRRGLPAPARHAADRRQRGPSDALDAPFGNHGQDGARRVSTGASPRTLSPRLIFPPSLSITFHCPCGLLSCRTRSPSDFRIAPFHITPP
jgi:hypothetical protein